MRKRSIITVGLCPAWDITCYAAGLDWADHKPLDRQTIVAAGKALNISRALAWMGIENTAAGLWGLQDYDQLSLAIHDPLIHLALTPVNGRTRQNVTVVDTVNKREMHLRAQCNLAADQTIDKLSDDLTAMVHSRSVILFAGSMPAEHSDRIIRLIQKLQRKGARIGLDSSGPAYKQIVESIPLMLIKPNLEELSELSGRPVGNTAAQIIGAARPLCERTRYVLVSRGKKGAILLDSKRAFSCRAMLRQRILKSVGCGDFLLAGLAANLHVGPEKALIAATKAASALAFGFYPEMSWRQARQKIEVQIRPL
ncbi:MAG: PfkB family carbohydrate kinase [Planctomycetaceae bacterium]|nr:PfkB family carbohydrate kinase [Planctomycetaceae bacterium]